MTGAGGEKDMSPGSVSRYFLRRFAIAARKKHIAASRPFHEALAETTLVFFGLPAVAALSFVGIITLRWWNPAVTSRWPGFSAAWLVLPIWVVCVAIGHLTIGRTFAKYRNGVSGTLEFASERDRRIVFWQKGVAFALCGIAAPWLGILVARLLK